MLGMLYSTLKDFDNSIGNHNRAIEIEPLAIYYTNRGMTYRRFHMLDKAMEDCCKAIEIRPDYIPLYINRANIYINNKDYDKALEDYAKAIDIERNAVPYYCRGECYVSQKNYKQALINFHAALNQKKDSIEGAIVLLDGENRSFSKTLCYKLIAFCHFKLNEIDDCLKYLQLAFENGLSIYKLDKILVDKLQHNEKFVELLNKFIPKGNDPMGRINI
jgi:tetratricopeptide (TPR) repeat protein